MARKDKPLTKVDRAVIRVLFGPKASRAGQTNQVDEELRELTENKSNKDGEK